MERSVFPTRNPFFQFKMNTFHLKMSQLQTITILGDLWSFNLSRGLVKKLPFGLLLTSIEGRK